MKEALARATADFFVAAVDSDRLYFPPSPWNSPKHCPGNVDVHMIDAPIGHDGFLTEIGQLNAQLRAHFLN